MSEFDWNPESCGKSLSPIPQMVSIVDHYKRIEKMEWKERVGVMLGKVHDLCLNCTMCHLGWKPCEEFDTVFDPHVFSNMSPSRWMVVGQNPGYNECIQHIPFVGEAGKSFDKALSRFGISRKNIYVTNTVKCHTIGNEKPTFEQVSRCEPILRLEIAILRPLLVITLGQVAFEILCGGNKIKPVYSENLGKMIFSEKFGVKVYPVYHPSPRNLSDETRKKKFNEQMVRLCKVIRNFNPSAGEDAQQK